ncbi:MAG: tetratricopeptide repeat protein, partial [Aestuariivirga sp.]|uniref:tetratricopeptide repeat protein n=1 Tax=Aestuariivirga sp. TaxID=2650926 RepID=UPI0038CF6769
YLVETRLGRLQALDIAWDVNARKWFHLYPGQNLPAGDGMHWTGTYKNWQARCATCHQTGFDKGYDFASRAYKTHWQELTVGCEACHGPGAAHAAWARTRDGADPYQSTAPKLGPGQQANEINTCGPCHARREAFSQVQPPAGAPFHDNYALSLLTPDLYFADGQQKEEVFILGSFLQSKMKARGVTCSNCHEPHGGGLVAEGNAVCTQCHDPAGREEFPTLRKADYDTPLHHRHTPGSEAAQCVSCHMPERSYMLIDPRRDHFFRRPDPLQSQAAGAPDVCTGCHTDKDPAWAAAQIALWHPAGDKRWQDRSAFIAFTQGDRSGKTLADLLSYVRDIERPGVARATALSLMGGSLALPAADAKALLTDSDPPVRAAAAGALRQTETQERIALLRPLLADPVRSVRQRAAVELAGAGVAALPGADDQLFRDGMRSFVDSRLANADTPESHMAIAGLALTRRQWQQAEAAFATAAEMDPQLSEAWIMQARLRAASGNLDGAAAALESGIKAQPKDINLRVEQAGIEMQRGRPDAAIAAYRQALDADGNRPDIWVALGVAAVSARNYDLALTAASKATTLDPQYAEPYVLAAMAQLARGQTEAARKAAQRGRALDPALQLPPDIAILLK